MKEIKAIIQPHVHDAVLDALHRIEGIPGVMSAEIHCTSARRGIHDPDKNIRVEVMVPDELAEQVIEAIQTNARTGKVGDGRIFVTNIDTTVVIRTGERFDAS